MSCDCNTVQNTCNDPCATTATNTAACESLPSALENFTLHFFGSVIKTETNGVVTWSLPCSLDIGLENNPRAADEGLACYFLRLFDEGITGLTGPKGDDGEAGVPGANAYTVTLASFTQPTQGSPNFSVKAFANPGILVGATVFIGGSGWHTVSDKGSDGTLFLTLIEGLLGVSGTVTAGKVVTMTGPRGLKGDKGDTGDQGIQGDQGPAGDEFTPTHDMTVGSGANHSLTLASAQIVFGGTEPQLTLPAVGDYLVEIIVGVTMDSTAATAPPEEITFKVWNATAAAFVVDIEQTTQDLEPDESGQIRMRSIVTTSVPNETIQLYGQISVTGKGEVIPARTSLSYVRLS